MLSWQGSETLPTIPDKNFAVFVLEEMAKVEAELDGAVAVVRILISLQLSCSCNRNTQNKYQYGIEYSLDVKHIQL